MTRTLLPILAPILAALVLLAACAHKPPPTHHLCGTGWDDCAWQQGWNDA